MAHFGAYNTSDSSTGNTPLAGNGTITLGPMQADTAQSVVGSVFADQAGILYVEQSFDGTNWDISNAITVTASTGQGFTQSIYAPVVRLRYVNGASGQGTFRLFARTFTTGR